ncbi:hypothetical protein [Pseudoalteromonas sp. T1lg48]|nr:hypothetical protein [Pseudoalteromonas sp. T1lg48]
MLRLIACFAATALLISCKSIPEDAYYAQEPIDVGYFGKFDYWQPADNTFRLTNTAKKARNKLVTDGLSVLIFDYEIDSNGYARNLRLVETLPANLITQQDLLDMDYAYQSWQPTKANNQLTPVTVRERIITLPNGDITMPEDEQSIEARVKAVIEHFKQRQDKDNA